VITYPTVGDLLAVAPGTDLGHSSWHTIEQPRIDAFSTATDDHQWIHVDPDRAANGPFGTTIAHGMLTLSLVPIMIGELLDVPGATFGLNYGFDRVRFTTPVLVGSRVRAAVSLQHTAPIENGAKVTFHAVVEVEGNSKPACLADMLIVWMA
jgi:acyl dehydratase